jgi:mannose-6-phosphate isomerase
MQSETGLSDPLKIAILTGFSLCDEYEKIRLLPDTTVSGTQSDIEVEKLTLSLISRLDHIIPENAAGTIYKLQNTVKNYDWGSPEWIPELMGKANESQVPWAELWMGVHPEGPSKISSPDGETTKDLSELINSNPATFLGKERAKIFNGLPFLLKILAAEKPLSIQAHPSLIQAQEGWASENEKSIALDSPERNYKDANHKPEIICALSPFTAMAGFREPHEIKVRLEWFLHNAPQSLLTALAPLTDALERENPLKTFLEELFSLDPIVREELGNYAIDQGQYGLYEYKSEYPDERKLIARFAKFFPDDPAIISPLYLNLIKLNPGEAIYLPAGIFHAYVYGLGIELMANSNNVLRGGLTPKHIDIPELLRVLDFKPFQPEILRATGETEYEYPVPCKEFSLSVIQGGDYIYLETGPSIILVTQGELTINGLEQTILKKGESAFIPAGNNGLKFSGNYTAYTAGIGPL